jgi:glycosyltransferase involved in cell wall biosynthesis
LSDALQNLEQNRDKMKKSGEAGRQRFDQLFHIDQSAADIADLYRQVRGVC